MEYFTVTDLKVLVFLLGTFQGICSSSVKEPDLSKVANILQTLFKTYTHSLQDTNFVINTDKPPKIEPTIEKFINRKVKGLKPFLQDYDNTENVMRENKYISKETKKELGKELNNEDDNITLEGEEDTTIIEFYPDTDNQKPSIRINENKQTEFKDNIKKYKIIRDKIKEALIEESVSFPTQKLITNTLDDMLASLVRSQCPENSNLDDRLNNGLHSRAVARTTKDLAKDWTEQWHAIRDKYTRISRDNFSLQPNPARKLFLFFEQIQEFLTNMVNDSEHISNNYKVVCKLVKRHNNMDEVYFNNQNLVNFRTGGQDRKTYNCPTFKICSDELKQFISRFYNNLNETAVSTFRNYAAMYMSDVNSDGSGEKESVIAVIYKVGNATEQKISKIFKKSTEKFDIDHDKNKDENIRLLRSYVSDTIDTCLYTIKSNVNSEVVSLRARLIDNLKQDLKSNINIDLENLAAELKDRICTDFSSCNSRIRRRSFDGYDNKIKSKAHKPIDKNKIYVKLQMNLDKKLKEDIARGNVDFFDGLMPIKNVAREQFNTFTKTVNVTRTTQHDKPTQAEIINEEKKNKIKNLENTLETEKSKHNKKKDQFKNTLIKEKSEKSSVSEEVGSNLKEDKLENNSETEESKSNKKKDNLKKTMKRGKSINNWNSENTESDMKEDKFENVSKMEESEKNSDIDVTKRTARTTRQIRKLTPTREMKSTRDMIQMSSTRLISQEVSAEILEYELF